MPNAPSVPGLSFRRFRGESDYPIMADVMQRSRDADQYDAVDTVEDIAADLKHPVNLDPLTDMLFAEINGVTVGFCRCQRLTAADGSRKYEVYVHLVPQWRASGLRRTMLLWNENRAREIDRELPKKEGGAFELSVTYAENHLKSLIEREGYRPYRYNILMTRPNLGEVPRLPIPEGAEVRPVRPEHHALIWKAESETMREQAVFDEELWSEEGLKMVSEMHIFQPHMWQVAWAGDEVVGAVLPWIDEHENRRYGRNWGYTQAVFTRKDWRNRGLASALIARAMVAVRDAGASEAVLSVDSDNPSGALRLYEKLGYRVQTKYAGYQKPLDG